MSVKEAEHLLRKDLRELCALFHSYGQDSLLLAALSYNIGPYKVLGHKGKYPKSVVLKKLESGNRNIRDDYVKYCRWNGKRIPSIERRRLIELMLLFKP
ncbi:MAG: lysozyme [Prevotellaceae bacterium]|nr:lysozyme [Prevotellaceae bacterium]